METDTFFCNICLRRFSPQLLVNKDVCGPPLSLDCGHTLCLTCARHLLAVETLNANKTKSIVCHICHKIQQLTPDDELSVNYKLLETIEQFDKDKSIFLEVQQENIQKSSEEIKTNIEKDYAVHKDMLEKYRDMAANQIFATNNALINARSLLHSSSEKVKSLKKEDEIERLNEYVSRVSLDLEKLLITFNLIENKLSKLDEIYESYLIDSVTFEQLVNYDTTIVLACDLSKEMRRELDENGVIVAEREVFLLNFEKENFKKIGDLNSESEDLSNDILNAIREDFELMRHRVYRFGIIGDSGL
jgi:hypothetical protein